MSNQEVFILDLTERLSKDLKRKAPMHEARVSSESTRNETRKRRGPTSNSQNKRSKPDKGVAPGTRSTALEKGHRVPREECLRIDPYADVQGPTLVVCRLCGTKITLSTRETYGTGPWDRHIKRCIPERADESSLDPDTSNTTNTPQETDKGSQSSQILISPGRTPLQLKTSVKHNRGFDESAIGEQSDCRASVSETTSPHVGASDEPPRFPKTPSRQSTASNDHVTASSGSQEGLASISIASPSNTSHDEAQSSIMPHDSEVAGPIRRSTDGAMTVSPHGAIFGDKDDSYDAISRSRIDDAGPEGKGQLGVAVDCTQLFEAAALKECHKEVTSDHRSLREEPTIEQKGELLRTFSSGTGDRNEIMPFTEPHPPTILPSPASESDFDFEYPDWEPSLTSRTFEHELLAIGICLENLIRPYGAMEIKFDSELKGGASRMVVA